MAYRPICCCVIERVRIQGFGCNAAAYWGCQLPNARTKPTNPGVLTQQQIGLYAIASQAQARIEIPGGPVTMTFGGRLEIDYSDVVGDQRQRTVITIVRPVSLGRWAVGAMKVKTL